MKVLLIGFTKIAYMPYMHFYIDELKKNDCKIELLYWKRDKNLDAEAPKDISTYMFEYEQEDSIPLRKKTRGFLRYRRYAKNILKRNKYDLVIVLHSTPGVLLYDLLQKDYKEKYILDYRDFTYENIKAYRKIIHNLVTNSYATFVSSDAYRKYMPECEKIYTSHNLLISNLKMRNLFKDKNMNYKPIKIRFWGFIRHKNINTSIINKLANDNRFELHYHGREQETAKYLKRYCKDNKVRNVFFHGEYRSEDRFEFAKDTDLLHNIYENDTKTINAMGNKYYDGIIFNIPQLCTEGSFMGEKINKRKIGLTVDPYSEKFADNIYEYYISINRNEIEKNCDLALDEIVNEYRDGLDIINKIITYGEEEKNV